jgi:MFS family permease
VFWYNVPATETRSSISVAKSYPTVVGLRVLVGAFEAFVNAAPLYLSLWYRRDELATRGAIFFATSAVAGSFNGIIAYGIGRNLNGAKGMAAWKWLFLIEGQSSHDNLLSTRRHEHDSVNSILLQVSSQLDMAL